MHYKEMDLKLVCVTLALASLLGMSSAYAADIKIGFVDAERINRESAPAEEASNEPESERHAHRLPRMMFDAAG